MPAIRSMTDDVTTAAEAIARGKEVRRKFYSVDTVHQEQIRQLGAELVAEKSRSAQLKDENANLHTMISVLSDDTRALRSRLGAYERSDKIANHSVRQIQASVCAAFNVHRADLLERTRNAKTVRMRQIAIFLCRKLTLQSFPQLGRDFGDLDHSTILHSVRKVQPVWDSLADVTGLTIVELANRLAVAWDAFYGSVESCNKKMAKHLHPEEVTA